MTCVFNYLENSNEKSKMFQQNKAVEDNTILLWPLKSRVTLMVDKFYICVWDESRALFILVVGFIWTWSYS